MPPKQEALSRARHSFSHGCSERLWARLCCWASLPHAPVQHTCRQNQPRGRTAGCRRQLGSCEAPVKGALALPAPLVSPKRPFAALERFLLRLQAPRRRLLLRLGGALRRGGGKVPSNSYSGGRWERAGAFPPTHLHCCHRRTQSSEKERKKPGASLWLQWDLWLQWRT